ncbi:MAG: alpha/beta hydrolase [Trichodesmium sp. St16_bin2-tuft]|jgi:Hydrolases of the alpha/beta superfamily|nr:alpha/beta hydrolase [Trichodesmium sp. St18_bin1]MDE5086266.1 alpha/beta hydrolase [Trichodesmium sp. St16_bin2-tuft]MDE5119770.1 alpha/beta hydrolase [Trichodesmium sp. St19_bin1]
MNKKNIIRLLIGKFSILRLIRSILIIYILIGFWAFFFSDRLIFLPRPSSYQTNQDFVKLKSRDRTQITGIYLPLPKAEYTILYSHGNGEDLGEILPRLRDLRDIGFNIFSYDYQGYGTSQGRPSVAGAYQDVNAAYEYLTQRLGIPANKIIVYGYSVGGGPSVDLASRQPVAGLVIESSFTTAFRVVTGIPVYPFDKFPNIDNIKNVNCPVLVIHGNADRVIPFYHGQQLFAMVDQPKLSFWVNGAGHLNLLEVAGEEYVKVMTEFIRLVQYNQNSKLIVSD